MNLSFTSYQPEKPNHGEWLCRYDMYDPPQLTWYQIYRKTLCGVWINEYGRKRFILTYARKQWACFTEKEARISYLARKQWQIKHLTRQLENAKIGLKIARKNCNHDWSYHGDNFKRCFECGIEIGELPKWMELRDMI